MKWTLAAVALLMTGLAWAQGTALSPTEHRTVPTDRPGENIRVIVVAAIDSKALFEELYAMEVK